MRKLRWGNREFRLLAQGSTPCKWHSQNPPHAGSKPLPVPLSNGSVLEFYQPSRFFSLKCKLSCSRIFKEGIQSYFCHLFQHVTIPYAKNLLTLLHPNILWHKLSLFTLSMSSRLTLFIEAVTQLEETVCLYAETKKKLRMKMNHLHSFKLLS